MSSSEVKHYSAKANQALQEPANVTELENLFDETVALFHRLRALVEVMLNQGELSAARRGVLRGLARYGPQTVPQMARARPVSRQYIQSLVNQLAEEGYVELVENLAHKRSNLVRLTEKGQTLLENIYQREAELLRELPLNLSAERLGSAVVVLQTVRQALETEQHRLLKELNQSDERS